jgi:hypothetical protein
MLMLMTMMAMNVSSLSAFTMRSVKSRPVPWNRATSACAWLQAPALERRVF